MKCRVMILIIFALLFFSAGCSPQEKATEPEKGTPPQAVNLINPNGPTVIPVAGITTGNIINDITVNVKYWNTIDQAIGLLADDEVQFAILPVTNAVNINASGLDLVLLGVHEWKVFYLVAGNGVEFEGWNSLVGKTVYTPNGKGQTADVLTRYALTRENIIPDQDVSFAYAPPQEIVALFKEGKIDFAALPEPYITLALGSQKGRIVVDYQEYWSQVSGTKNGIPIAGLFVKRSFLNDYPEVADKVAKTLADSTNWGNENPAAALEASAEILPLPPAVMQASLERIVFKYLPADEIKDEVITFLTTVKETYPEGIKQIPDHEFFAKQ
jgi:NitT/TauT family transport system substrate-binding protein